MSRMIQEIFRNGSLNHLPARVIEARVVVEFAEESITPSNRRRGIVHFGMFAPPDGKWTTDEEIERVKKSWNAKLDE